MWIAASRIGTPSHTLRPCPHPHRHTLAYPRSVHAHDLAHRLKHLVAPHSHDSAYKVDAALEGSAAGLRALWLSLVGLGVTAVLQAFVAAWSGSVALLGDTLHNVADALTAVPLGLAFIVGRRPANPPF